MGTLKMSSRERLHLELVGRVERKELTAVKAAELAGISLRQMRRICKRHRAEGDSGLVHRSRGRRPNNRLPDKVRSEVVLLYREKFGDFGPTLACEKLVAEGYELSSDTLGRSFGFASDFAFRNSGLQPPFRLPPRLCNLLPSKPRSFA